MAEAQSFRGKIPAKSSRERISRAETAQQMLATPDLAYVANTKPSELIRLAKVDRWAAIAQDAVAAAELSMNHVLTGLRKTDVDGALWRSLKDATTVFAILVDKGRVLEDLLAHLDGRTTGANLAELNRQAAQIVAVTKELERRSNPVDVTPAPASPRGPDSAIAPRRRD